MKVLNPYAAERRVSAARATKRNPTTSVGGFAPALCAEGSEIQSSVAGLHNTTLPDRGPVWDNDAMDSCFRYRGHLPQKSRPLNIGERRPAFKPRKVEDIVRNRGLRGRCRTILFLQLEETVGNFPFPSLESSVSTSNPGPCCQHGFLDHTDGAHR